MSFEKLRDLMIYHQIEGRGIANDRVLMAMRKVPRERFVPEDIRTLSYIDGPLPIDMEQSISEPFIVAYMAEALKLQSEHRVLEVGTGSGYNAAILSLLARDVYSVEIIKTLAEEAADRLWINGHENVFVKEGDGYLGWEEKAPFDRIILTAAPTHIPKKLTQQLAVGGIMVAPIGNQNQFLYRVTKKDEDTLEKELLIPVKFVPMTRNYEQGGHSKKQKVA